MRLRWERRHQTRYLGFSEQGIALAQVIRVTDPSGGQRRWSVRLLHDRDELEERFSTYQAAMEAAERALGPDE